MKPDKEVLEKFKEEPAAAAAAEKSGILELRLW